VNELGEWLTCIRKGDKSAFEKLYETMKGPLYTIVLRITKNNTQAEDVLQVIFLKIYFSPREPSSNPRVYLFKMARNMALDMVRKRKPTTDLEEAESERCHHTEDLPQKMDIENAIQSLPERERQIVTLHINGELKFREVATILEIPLGTVLWAYQKAIKQLRIILGGAL